MADRPESSGMAFVTRWLLVLLIIALIAMLTLGSIPLTVGTALTAAGIIVVFIGVVLEL